MKKIALITIHVGANFGSVLQTVASVKLLEKLGFKCDVVNYIPSRITLFGYLFARKSFYGFLRNLFFLPIKIINDYVYQHYLQNHVRLTRAIYNNDVFNKCLPEFDYYITGSDQVWNSFHNEGLDLHYYWQGLPDTAQRISFASSFGVSDLSDTEFCKVKSFLKLYKAISVRERSAVSLINKMGYDATELMDPIFSLSCEEWSKYMSKRLVVEDYVLVYTPYNVVDSDVIYESAANLASIKGLRTVAFSWDFRRNNKVDITMRFCSPGDFISLVYYAKYVITNSFHGTAFSINFNKQFWTYMPSQFTTRLYSVLNLVNLEQRIKKCVVTNKDLDDYIDYDTVNIILQKERDRTKNFLLHSLT